MYRHMLTLVNFKYKTISRDKEANTTALKTQEQSTHWTLLLSTRLPHVQHRPINLL